MGSPISPIIANIFMEEFEVKALQSFPNPPSMWLRFVDDTFVINRAEYSQSLLQHINSQDPHIQFTVEPTQHGSLPFLDTLVTIQPDNTLSTSVYRKPTYTDQHLHWDSNHHITAKHSVYNTLAHRAKTVSSTQESFDKELSHIKSALQHCQFPNWALNQWEYKFKHPNQPPNANPTNTNNNQDNNNKYKTTIVVPYIPQTADKFKRICKAKKHPSAIQRNQHTQDHPSQPQGQRSQIQTNRSHLPIPMPPCTMFQFLHRGVRQIPRR